MTKCPNTRYSSRNTSSTVKCFCFVSPEVCGLCLELAAPAVCIPQCSQTEKGSNSELCAPTVVAGEPALRSKILLRECRQPGAVISLQTTFRQRGHTVKNGKCLREGPRASSLTAGSATPPLPPERQSSVCTCSDGISIMCLGRHKYSRPTRP